MGKMRCTRVRSSEIAN